MNGANPAFPNINDYETTDEDIQEQDFQGPVENIVLSPAHEQIEVVAQRISVEFGNGNVGSLIGIYFWCLQLGSSLYKIYIGKTKGLIRRIGDYSRDFQVHSPNDYKLRFFQEYVFGIVDEASFHLYFRNCPENDLAALETDMIQAFKPLINSLPHGEQQDRDAIQLAFQMYYQNIFNEQLGAG